MSEERSCPSGGGARAADAPSRAPREAKARWALVAGRRGRGRITQLEQTIAGLRARGVAVGGVVQRALDDDRGEHAGYLAVALAGDGEIPLARPATSKDALAPDGKQLICSFTFDSTAFGVARAWVARDADACDVVVVDEVSKLEVGRGGHHDAIEAALAGRAVALLSVRSEQLFAVMERFGLDEPVAALEAGDDGDVGAFVDAVAGACARQARAGDRD